MQPTVEVRWFYKGGIPETTSQRFRSGDYPRIRGQLRSERIYTFISQAWIAWELSSGGRINDVRTIQTS
jgi:hypothetical protein